MLAAFVRSLPPEGVRRPVTLLFVDLTGSTKLSDRIEQEQYHEVMSQVRAIWRNAAKAHGAWTVRSQGDGALLAFGLPELHEEDGRRAAEAALDIQQQVAALRFADLPPEFSTLSVHSGIHSGTALVLPGDIELGLVDLKGTVPNIAAKLCTAARGGEIIASLDALGPHQHFFDLLEPAGAQDDAARYGGLHPQRVRHVLGRSGVQRPYEAFVRRGRTDFLGRADGLAQLRGFLAGADAHSCTVVVGEAGVGKTRLIEEAVRHAAPGTTVVQGVCERESSEPLHPFLQMVRSWFGLSRRVRMDELPQHAVRALLRFDEALGAWAQSLRPLLCLDAPAPARRSTTTGIIGDLLAFWREAGRDAPLAMVIDDWQWADAASLQLLDSLLRLPSPPRILLASRPRDNTATYVQGALHVHLQPLEPDETEAAVKCWLPFADPFLCSRIQEYSGGVPLYIEELCHSASVGQLARTIGTGETPRHWLARLAVARLDRLAPPLRRLVQAAAVAGNEVPLPLLAHMAGASPGPQDLAELRDADFLYPAASSAAVRFKHGITRDSIYEAIGLRERTAFHERALAAMREQAGQPGLDADVDALAYHSAGAGRWQDAAGFAEQAGDRAMGAFALDRARAHYEAALRALERIPGRQASHSLHWCLVANKLGMACVFDPLPLQGDTSLFERAVATAGELGDTDVRARALYWLAYIDYAIGRFRDAARTGWEALRCAEAAADEPLAVQVKAMMGQVLAGTGDYERAVELVDVAVDAKKQRKRPRGGLAIGSAYALAVKGGMLADRGEFTSAHGCFAEAMDLLEGSTHPVGNSVRNWIAVAYNWQGRWQQAEEVATESARIGENTRALLLLSAARSSLGYAQWSGRGAPEGVVLLREAMRWMDEREATFYTSIYFGWLVCATAAHGRFDEARAYAGKVLRRARQGERLGEAVACRALAWIASQASDAAGAARWLERAEVAARRRQSPRELALNGYFRGQLAAAIGQQAHARRSIESAAAQFASLDMHWHRDAALRHLGAPQQPAPLVLG